MNLRPTTLTLCFAIIIALSAKDEPLVDKPSSGSKIQITANGLRIEPGGESNFLRFENGVRITGAGFSLRADVVELDVAGSSVEMKDMHLPELKNTPPERIIADPGAAVQQMAREVKPPSARIAPSAVKRIAASGSVVVSGQGAELSTATVYSTDGGQTWSTDGKAIVTLRDTKHGQSAKISAQQMSFSTQSQLLLARGGISGELKQKGQDALGISAGELRADLRTNKVEIKGGLKLTRGTMALSTIGRSAEAQMVRLDLNTKEVTLSGEFELADSEKGLNLTGSGLSGSLDEQQSLEVAGGVVLRDPIRGLLLTAGKVSARLEPLSLTASGEVHLEYGKSTYDAGQAVITREGDKYIVEMNGPQKGSIDVQALKK